MEEMTNVLATLTKSIESILETQKQLTEQISRSNGSSVQKKPTNASPAPRLNANCSLREFSSWKLKWADYCLLNNVEKLELKEQKAVFRSLLSDEWYRVIQFVLQIKLDDESITNNEIINEMQAYLRSQRNVVLDRKDFYLRNQQQGESFDDYYMTLQEIAAFCDFCETCLADQYRDRIMTGISDEETLRELLTEKELTLEKAVAICRARENANKDNEALQDSSVRNVTDISKVSSYRKEKLQSTTNNQRRESCTFCGYKWHDKLANCPARGKQCNACGEFNHFANSQKCKNPTPHKSAPGRRKIQRLIINDVSIKQRKEGRKSPKIKIMVRHKNTEIQIPVTPDTGAEITVMPIHDAIRLGVNINNLKPPENKLHAANGKELTCLGTFTANLQLGDIITTIEISVVKEIQNFLLSWYHAIDLHILPACFPEQINIQQMNAEQKTDIKTKREPPSIPEKYNPTLQEREEHVKQIKEAFPSVFDTSTVLKPMKGEPMRIPLSEDAVPYSITTARNIPYGWRDKVKRELDEMVEKEIITEVVEPTQWCHPIVIQPKKESEDIRLCVDLTKLNKYVKRATYPSTTPYDAVSNISTGVKYFTTLDAKSGYWQIPIAQEDQHLTTFITPWGRYQFRRAPMGLISSGDEYTRRGDQVISNIANVIKIVDDILAHDEDYKSHINRVWNILEKCEENNITLNPKKFTFAQQEVNYCGYILNETGFTADKGKVNAIEKFKTPTCITDIRSFMGLVGQLSDFSTEIANRAEPLRQLLKKNNEWMWTPVHEQAFKDVKEAITSPPILAYFKPNLPISLQTDASKLNGLGYALMQKHRDGWKLIKCGSRFLSETESRYAIIEQEMLAVTWATRKCQRFLRGAQHYDVIIDHRPLVPILNSKGINDIENPRLQRMKEKLSQYNFTASWKKGKEHAIPDALSRSPVDQPTEEDEEAELEIEETIKSLVSSAIQSINTSSENHDRMTERIIKAGNEDNEYTKLRKAITDGLPEHKSDWEPVIRGYFNMKNKLMVDGKLVLCGHRLVIPYQLRKEMLNRLHVSHQGIERTKGRARQTLFWPNIDNDITNICKCCKQCQKYLPSNQKEPIMHDIPPKRVFQYVSSDYFEYAGKSYLIYVDRYSGYPMVKIFEHEATSRQLITTLRYIFSLTGAPEVMRCDNGPQYTAKRFRDFLQRWDVQIKPSTPHYPQSNGHAEVTVKAVKHLIAKCSESGDLDNDDFAMGLLELRNTPRADGRSPAQILFGHSLRSNIPVHHSAFAKEHQKAMEECDRIRINNQGKADARYNKSAKTLPSFAIGHHVNIQNPKTGQWDKNGIIVGIGENRDYLVKLNSGRIYWRNRRFLRTRHSMSPSPPGRMPEENQAKCPPQQIPKEHPQTVNRYTPKDRLNRRIDTPEPTNRKSNRHTVKPKRLVMDPKAKVYDEAE